MTARGGADDTEAVAVGVRCSDGSVGGGGDGVSVVLFVGVLVLDTTTHVTFEECSSRRSMAACEVMCVMRLVNDRDDILRVTISVDGNKDVIIRVGCTAGDTGRRANIIAAIGR